MRSQSEFTAQELSPLICALKSYSLSYNKKCGSGHIIVYMEALQPACDIGETPRHRSMNWFTSVTGVFTSTTCRSREKTFQTDAYVWNVCGTKFSRVFTIVIHWRWRIYTCKFFWTLLLSWPKTNSFISEISHSSCRFISQVLHMVVSFRQCDLKCFRKKQPKFAPKITLMLRLTR
jgi:hypothetical protein